jgi:hypothetical protein
MSHYTRFTSDSVARTRCVLPRASLPGFPYDSDDAERVESGVDGAQSCERARA